MSANACQCHTEGFPWHAWDCRTLQGYYCVIFYKKISCPNKHGGTSQCWVPTYEIFHKLQKSVGFFAKELPGISYSTEKLRTVTCPICITVKQYQMKFVPGPVIWGGGVGFYLQSCYVSLLDWTLKCTYVNVFTPPKMQIPLASFWGRKSILCLPVH